MLLAVLMLWIDPSPARAQATPVWMEDLKAPLELRPEDGVTLTQYAVMRLRSGGIKLNLSLSPHLAQDTQPRVVLLSFTDGNSAAEVRVGSGRGIFAAIDQAVGSGVDRPDRVRWLKLDIVRSVRNAQSRWTGDTLGIEHGEGVALVRPSRVAISWEELSVRGLVSDKMRFDPHLLKEIANDADGIRPVHFFKCDSFYTDGHNVRRVRHDLWQEERSATQADFDLAIDLATDYMKRAVGQDGKFVYLLDPTGQETPPGPGQPAEEYNIVRHAGSLLALVYADEIREGKDKELRKATLRAIRYLLAAIVPAKGVKDADVIVENDSVKLGAVGLAVNAICRYTKVTGDDQFLPAARRLANWIVQNQSPEGRFLAYEQRFSDGTILRRMSPYATGEAIWGLCALHELVRDGPWLDTAERAMDYFITTRERAVTRDLRFTDHWLLYSIEHLNAAGRRNSLYASHARRMIQTITDPQIAPNLEQPLWAGAYMRPPNTNQTATRVEGLTAGYRFFATQCGADLEMSRVRSSVEAASRFLFRQQFLIPQAMYHPRPADVLGGFRGSSTDARIRIDTVQHALVALIGTRDVLFGRR